MKQVYVDICVFRTQIFRWCSRFKTGMETTENEAISGGYISDRNEEFTTKVKELIYDNRCWIVKTNGDEFAVSRETIGLMTKNMHVLNTQ